MAPSTSTTPAKLNDLQYSMLSIEVEMVTRELRGRLLSFEASKIRNQLVRFLTGSDITGTDRFASPESADLDFMELQYARLVLDPILVIAAELGLSSCIVPERLGQAYATLIELKRRNDAETLATATAEDFVLAGAL